MDFVAHVKKTTDGRWLPVHSLEEHLYSVASLAKHNIHDEMSSVWAELAGKWHDLGKFQSAFQDYIHDKSGFERENAHIETASPSRVTHSTAGAFHAIRKFGPGLGHILAYLIAGHHAGLPDYHGGKGSLAFRLGDAGEKEYLDSLKASIPADLLDGQMPGLPAALKDDMCFSLWLRMIFSALVDADFLDTEEYMDSDRTSQRGRYPAIQTLHIRFSEFMEGLQGSAADTAVNKIRKKVFQSCITAAVQKPGVFSLTVPTGGGKSLASLGFALEHARIHGKQRIVYGIPFTSIIEQNAAVFRHCLGDDAVLEHHSNLDVSPEKENSQNRLAAENWDAPLIVTTNVQLFESLHASRTSRCRKLHNLQDAVIILDEAQQLPRNFHAPIVRCMKNLSQYFGVTWVLCTATQPDFSTRKDAFNKTLLEGFDAVHEIVARPDVLAQRLKRVEIEMPDPKEKDTWEEIASRISAEECVLAIVNTRRHARDLFRMMPDDGNNFHLSAQMCAQHRSAILATVKARLQSRHKGNDESPLRLISTQLVEAGVDVDFPVVYRAMAGLDSLAQSAGRCNREGKRPSGRVVVFNPPENAPPGFLRQAQQVTELMLKAGELGEPLSPSTFKAFFQRLNDDGDRDKHGINKLLQPQQDPDTGAISVQFRNAAEKFRMIDDNGVTVVVPYIPEGGQESPVSQWLSMLEANPTERWIYKKLQRYTITIPESLACEYQRSGVLDVKAGQMRLLDSYYDSTLGALPPDSLLSAETSVVC